MKFVFPTLWIGGFAAATVFLFSSPGSSPDVPLKWIFLSMTVAGALFIRWACMRLKRVRMDDQALYISNYLREIAVPLSNVAEVTENRWLNDRPVTIRFHSPTEFGSRVVFTPKWRWLAIWSSHPVVEEIRSAVARATGRGPAEGWARR
jgi:hypothetical protein